MKFKIYWLERKSRYVEAENQQEAIYIAFKKPQDGDLDTQELIDIKQTEIITEVSP